jgi:hypothetical protein
MVSTQPDQDVANRKKSGLARHDLLYAGEWQNRSFTGQAMHLIRDGLVDWTWEMPWDGEFGDISLMPNGDVLFAWYGGIARITGLGRVLWKWIAPLDTEVHTCQPIGEDSVFVVANGQPATAFILSMKDRSVEWSATIPTGGGHPHGMFRHSRLTANGELVIAHLDMDRMVKYDLNMRPQLVVETPSPWAAVPLSDGGYLVSGDAAGYVAEFDARGRPTWSFDREQASGLGIDIFTVQQAQRLANGNTVFANWSGNQLPEAESAGTAQLVEVTASGSVDWVLSEWSDPDLGVASNIHVFDGLGSSFPMRDR